ncbi:hypothetical protein GYMLUDRAFT_52909 [Collybiopsis luxurians FD-317 M1]|nr:hypothetical protein GYMLUDRAFT_52909 [Collybiopsis luxurians FD-317 M1]
MEGAVFHDPLALNIRRQIQILLSKLPSDDSHLLSISNSTSISQLLANLSRALSIPPYTTHIATLFRPILFDLCARWAANPIDIEQELVALSLLIEVHEELFPILYRVLQNPAFVQGPVQFVLDSPDLNAKRTHQILLAYYRILQANRQLPYLLYWPLTPLYQIASDAQLDSASRLLAIRCYALQSGMGEADREKWEKAVFGELYGVDCPLGYGDAPDGSQVVIDGWLMPIIELERVRTARNAFVAESHDFYSIDGDSVQVISPSDLCPLVVNLHGVLLLRSSAAEKVPSSLIPTPTAVTALRSLALHLTSRLPTLLTSPPSSGKTLLLSHLAETLFPDVKNQLVFIHLADTSLDPRSLLGSHVSSKTQPGTFEWKEGILVQAMREGKWVVFKDIDRGSNEVLALIKPLIESHGLGKWIGGRASLEVAGRGKVVAADSFAIFATRSVLPSKSGVFPNATFYGSHKLHEVIITSPSVDELELIVKSRYPQLTDQAAKGLVHFWGAIRQLGNTAFTRDIGLRELEKFCVRTEQLISSHQAIVDSSESDENLPLSTIFPNTSLREQIFLAARDVFFGSGSTTAAAQAHVKAIAHTAGTYLELELERQEWLLSRWVPDFEIETDKDGRTTAVRLGHTRLLARPAKREINASVPRPFAMHRPATLLMSRIVDAIALSEPVLLTGETGTGKTSVVTHLAHIMHQPLTSLNLSNQTESSDLIGGFRPLDARVPAMSLQSRFLDLFGETFSRKRNEKFETDVRKSVTQGKWKRAVGLWKESVKLAKDRIMKKQNDEGVEELDSQTPRKRRKLDASSLSASQHKWTEFERDVEEFNVQYVSGKGRLAFGFVEGPLVEALRNGNWVLLDEVNLASPETLECISGILRSPTASITLTEQGSLDPVPRHPNFRLFACMNPATDVGKKDLPPNIRSRFTEIDVPPPDADRETLLSIITQYIGASAVSDKAAIMNVAEFYLSVKELAEARQIADGSNHRPYYSMRTLARALTFASDIAGMYGLRRAIWEGCLMAFTMVLDAPSAELVTALAQKHLLAGVKNVPSLLARDPSLPHSLAPEDFIQLGHFYLERGPLPLDSADDYILTPSVERKLIDLARIILTRRFPVLIEGPTSSGKTSSVEYLAKRTGHRFIRINNHEHTDIQEYLGSYVPHPVTGKLVFTDGLLVQALRKGDWIVLDELNLAPTDVLEALNRLLDDNRELVIPETGEIVRPHPNFMLFATQNPPGLYAGRKVLSRAFRNRFLEVHFDDVPETELETILCQRCAIAPSYGKKIVMVFRELQKRRQAGRVFESKHGFATLRDLFRWAGRDAVGYQELADNGFMLLAERARREDDKVIVKEVIESIMGVKIDERRLYDFQDRETDFAQFLGCGIPSDSSLIWTKAMRRLFILLTRALRFNEPVLLVGETGSGKTSVCQVYAEVTRRNLHGLNCHQNTETADLIGGLRPVRNRATFEREILQKASALSSDLGIEMSARDIESLESQLDVILNSTTLSSATKDTLDQLRRQIARSKAIFEWHDGPLVEAMRGGDVFLLDEISLADDSVLERLNSVLEPSRTLVLAEKAADETQHASIVAHEYFKLVATMNPGGDYGKKELSPALRNRFTEIWVPSVDDRGDLHLIVSCRWKHEVLRQYTTALLDFVEWLAHEAGDTSLLNLRDILAWVSFSNATYDGGMPAEEIFHHAAHMTYLDGLASVPSLSPLAAKSLQELRLAAETRLNELVPRREPNPVLSVHDSSSSFQLGYFSIVKGPRVAEPHSFNFQAPTTQTNALRVVRACQLSKPILLEGSPGVGKTSLVTALAKVSGHELCRINLSDQTDLIDLFGSDLPADNGKAGEFIWKDGEFLRALQEGNWVLLDEMNLAPQAVLEGLNAVLDHRGAVYIPELGRTFTKHPNFRIFAAQNPLSQGGGRKGLPKSFVNRFTKVYVDRLSASDLLLVCKHLHPDVDREMLRAMIAFNKSLDDSVSVERAFGREGAPWEFNLRDVLRWIHAIKRPSRPTLHPSHHIRTIYLHRFRNWNDRRLAQSIFERTFSCSFDQTVNPTWTISASEVSIGLFHCARQSSSVMIRPKRLLKSHLSALEALGCSISHSLLAIVTGARNTGKTALIQTLADMTGRTMQEVHMNSTTDAMDLLGSFEQLDSQTRVRDIALEMMSLIEHQLRIHPEINLDITAYVSLRRAISGSTPWVSEAILRAVSELANVLSGTPFGAQISSARTQMQQLLDVSQGNNAGRFEWIDGPLVRALKAGHWLLLDGANLCNPSILDRLNSLCEADGSLTLSEKGFVNGELQILKPHPNFRLFMTVDPQYGELSRAMRNRGVEIALVSSPLVDDRDTLHDYFRLPSILKGQNNILSPNFAAVRLGIYYPESQGLESRIPSSRVLDQDSTLCHLVDIAPLSDLTVRDDNAIYHFLSRTVTPLAVPLLSRFLQSRQDMNDLESLRKVLYTAVEVLVEFRNRHGMASLPHMLGMPIDFFLAIQPFDWESDHLVALNVLRLAVEVNLDQLPSDAGTRSTFLGDPRVQQSRLAINALRKEGLAMGAMMLKAFSDASTVSSTDIQTLTVGNEVLYYTQKLRDIASRNVLDYSALQPLTKQLVTVAQMLPDGFTSVKDCIADLEETTTLSSGLGLNQIWSMFYNNRLTVTDAQRLDDLIAKIDGPQDLKRQVLHLMAMASIVRSSGEGHLTSKINEELLRRARDRDTPRDEKDTLKLPHLFTRLSLLVSALSARRLSTSTKRAIENLISIGCGQPFAKLSHLVTYQQSLWLDDALQNLPNPKIYNTSTITTALFTSWMNDLWCHEDDLAASLFHPGQLRSVLSVWDWKSTPLENLFQYEVNLRSHAELALLNTEQVFSRCEQLTILVKHSIMKIASCFPNVDNRRERSGPLLMALERKVNDLTIPELGDALDHPSFKQAVETHLLPAFYCSNQATESYNSRIARLGLCWMSVGRLLFDLFIPDAPIDPAAVQSHFYTFWSDRASSLLKELALHSEFENLSTGNTRNGAIDYLRQLLAVAQGHLVDGPPPVPYRDVSRLQMFWSEVLQFQRHVLDHTKLDALVNLLQVGDDSAGPREEVIQRSMQGFLQRLEAVYREFDDVIFPIRYAVLHFQMGLRILKLSPLSNRYSITSAVAAFPTVRSAASLITMQHQTLTSELRAFQHLVLQMAAVTLEFTAGIDIKLHLSLVEKIYEQALRLWHIDRKREEEQQKASESLYRQSRISHEMESDIDIEEREFRELFPSFESVLSNDSASPDQPPPCQVPESDFRYFVRMHSALFSGESLPTSWYRAIQLSVLPDLLISDTVSAGTLDYDALPLSISLLADRSAEVHESLNVKLAAYNFYSDANIQETRKGASVVTKMKDRLATLIQEWPDQMVLRHLKDRCDVILALDLRSPVAKVLSALEQLLLHSEDWEAYANRENNLRVHRSDLIELIVAWRRLELSCWKDLLEVEAKTFEDAVSPWWFRLYDAIIRGPLDILQRDNVETVSSYLDSLVPLLDDFIRQSPLGQFHVRLRLLNSFGEVCCNLSKIHRQQRSDILERTHRIVHSTVRYFTTISNSVAADLASERSALETDVRNLIKLASWKDVNVHALKQSAQRTHHQLFKIIRKFREILRKPLSTRIEAVLAEVSDDEKAVNVELQLDIARPSSLSFPTTASLTQMTTPSHLIHLGRTYNRFEELVVNNIIPSISSKSPHPVESLAVDIIVSSKELSSISIPSSLPPDRREKQQKALLTRKRKAWSDLLKELKKAGFAAHAKQEILRQNGSTRWVREQPTPSESFDTAWNFQKSETYWNRLNALLPLLRHSMVSHHDDISTRDLQRGVSFLESSFSMAAESRTRLANACEAYTHLRQHVRRIRGLASSGGTIFSDNAVLPQLTAIFSVLARTESTLYELQNASKSFTQLDPLSPLNPSVTDNIRSILTSCIDLKSRFRTLMSNVQLSSFTILLAAEYELVTEVLQFIQQVIRTLQSCIDQESRLGPFLHPTLDWLRSYQLDFSPKKSLDHSTTANNSDEIINACLAGVEILLAKSSNSLSAEDGDEDNYIRRHYQDVRELTAVFNIGHIIELLNISLEGFAAGSALDVHRYLPFLEHYTNLVHVQLISHAGWTKSLLKLTFILCSVLNTICQQGFCKPPDADQEGDSMADAAGVSDGVGLGEGSGANNVSKDIQEESQVEGLQGDEADTNPSRNEKEDDAVEMSQDFGGEMEDMSDGSQDEGSDQGSSADPEEQIGDLDASDPTAVDEKFWGNEKGPENSGENKTSKDSSTQQSGDSEVVAKEGEKKPEAEKDDAVELNEPTVSQPEEVQPELEDSTHPDTNGAPMDEHVHEVDTLDLPDDMNMDTGDAPDEMDIDQPHNEEVEEDVGDSEEAMTEAIEEQPGNDSELPPTEQPNTQEPEGSASAEAGVPDDVDGQESLDDENATVAQPDVSKGEGDVAEQSAPENDQAASSMQSGISMGMAGEAAAASEHSKDQHGLDTDDRSPTRGSDQDLSMDGDPSVGAATVGLAHGQQTSRQNEQLSNNPLRSMADALQEVQRRFDEILNNSGLDVPEEQLGALEHPTAIEYLCPEDTDYDMQALGPAQEDQAAKLQELNLIDEGLESDTTAFPLPDVDMPIESEDPQEFPHSKSTQSESKGSEGSGDVESAIAQNGRPISFDDSAVANHDGPKTHVNVEDPAEVEDLAVELELRSWQAAGLPEHQAANIWRMYESLTHELAYTLCEQLRLILEPTLATRLKGDYRTGKRLNMKKIIPYIASDYTKDKIWLRRTRPSQREYQILIALDDSRSMAESHSVHLAYQTLALVSKALTRLEAGDIGIARFGQEVQMLHGFEGAPFSDQMGIEVIKAFQFDQKATDVLSLVDTSLRVLEAARERRSVSSSTAADLWQLEIIISDGMCQDHDKLRAVLRKAEEQRVMIVFIILDSLHSGSAIKPGSTQGSILSMERAEFKNMGGKMELQLQRYLDSFPFEYYVVLRDVEALPNVLSTTLKQFFERISEE